MLYKCANAYYFSYINKIGGIESHLYYISRKYGKYDMCVFYQNGDPRQIERLRKYIKAVKIDMRDRVVCKKLFCCFNREILDICKADWKALVLHGDYSTMLKMGQLTRNQLPLDPRIDQYLGVSQLVCDSWLEATGIKAINIGEPVILDKIRKPLMFVSATRLSKEKGWWRMQKLAEEMDRKGLNYQWFIYTDSKQKPMDNMVFCEPRLDIADKINGFDAFIQLSDNEGFCLAIVEALMRGVPVIATDLPVLDEIGLNEMNSIRLPLDMKHIPIDKIERVDKMHFKYHEPKDRWDEFLDHTKAKLKNKVKVKAMDGWQMHKLSDSTRGIIPEPGSEWIIDWNRLEELQEYEKRTGIKLIEEV